MPVSSCCAYAGLLTFLAALLPGNPAYGQSPPPRNVIAPAGTELRTLAQHSTDDEANWFYNVPQGSKLLPYAWFLHLEQPGVEGGLLRDNTHIQSLGYLPRVA